MRDPNLEIDILFPEGEVIAFGAADHAAADVLNPAFPRWLHQLMRNDDDYAIRINAFDASGGEADGEPGG